MSMIERSSSRESLGTRYMWSGFGALKCQPSGVRHTHAYLLGQLSLVAPAAWSNRSNSSTVMTFPPPLGVATN